VFTGSENSGCASEVVATNSERGRLLLTTHLASGGHKEIKKEYGHKQIAYAYVKGRVFVYHNYCLCKREFIITKI
jgi:nitrite reductase/ring-hydroxylating ferredoxin subunit